MHDLEQEIRDLINEPRARYLLEKDIGRWYQTCSSLDVIGDATLAIDAYVDGGIGASDTAHMVGAQYLKVYGLLQVLVVQQDAIGHLYDALDILGRPFDIKNYPKLDAIRTVRNASIGHPTKKDRPKPVSYHFISRVTLRSGSFDLLSSDEHGNNAIPTIKIGDLIANQREEGTMLLKAVSDELKRRRAEHRAKFKMEKLIDEFSSHLGYAFEKINEAIKGSGEDVQGQWGIKEVQRSLTCFRSALARRDIAVETYPGIEYAYEELGYSVEQLSRYLEQEPSDIQTVEMAGIVLFFIKKKVEELKSMAGELDDDYAADETLNDEMQS